MSPASRCIVALAIAACREGRIVFTDDPNIGGKTRPGSVFSQGDKELIKKSLSQVQELLDNRTALLRSNWDLFDKFFGAGARTTQDVKNRVMRSYKQTLVVLQGFELRFGSTDACRCQDAPRRGGVALDAGFREAFCDTRRAAYVTPHSRSGVLPVMYMCAHTLNGEAVPHNLLHEALHVARPELKDHAYGPAKCATLATSDPTLARENCDSYVWLLFELGDLARRRSRCAARRPEDRINLPDPLWYGCFGFEEPSAPRHAAKKRRIQGHA